MSTDFSDLNYYFTTLYADAYPQPIDTGHLTATEDLLAKWLPMIRIDGEKTVLDVGCGQGLAKEFFEQLDFKWKGCTLGQEDYDTCKALGYDIDQCDAQFLPYTNGQFKLIYARHVLEHVISPITVLMELHRVCVDGGLLIAVMPKPRLTKDGPGEILGGRQHYWLLLPEQWRPILARAGWDEIWFTETDNEMRWLCGKIRRPRPEEITSEAKS